MTEDMSSQDTTAVETAENTVETVVGNADEQASNQEVPSDFEPLTATYERLRHSTDAAELSEFARRPLPDRSEQAAFSRATALLEAVAGNAHTPLEDRVFLAETMPFPNILVKLSTDESVEVRKAVAGNANDKNWLVGRMPAKSSSRVAAIPWSRSTAASCAPHIWCFRQIFPRGITPLKSPLVARRRLQPLSALRKRSSCLTT